MSFYVEDRGRINQSTYWMYFGAYFILTPVLLVGGGYELFTGSYAAGAICILLLLPMSLYFRVIVMRRCRDIGWPAFLPWLMLGLSTVMGFISGARAGMAPHTAVSTVGTAMVFSMVFSMLLGLADFVLQIVVGCIGTKDRSANVFGDDEFDPRSLPQAPRRLAESLAPATPMTRARPLPSGHGEASAIASVPASMAAVSPRPGAGFGRRAV